MMLRIQPHLRLCQDILRPVRQWMGYSAHCAHESWSMRGLQMQERLMAVLMNIIRGLQPVVISPDVEAPRAKRMRSC